MFVKQRIVIKDNHNKGKNRIMTDLNKSISAALLLAALILAPATVKAYSPAVRYYGKQTYGAATQNWAGECNEEGIAFFANNNGILIFDSEEWTLIPNHNRTNTRSLYYDRQENVLYAGATNELGKISLSGGTTVYTSLLDTLGVTVSEIWNIGRLGEDIFFQDDRHIYILKEQGERSIKTYTFENRIFCSTVIGEELLLYVYGAGCFTLKDNALEPIRGTGALKDSRVCSIFSGPEAGELLFVTKQDGVFRLKDGVLTEEKLPFTQALRRNIVYTAAVSGSTIAFGTVTNGVYILNRDTGEWFNINTDTGFGNNTVLGLRFDPSGNIWACLDNGIGYIDLTSAEMDLFGKNEIYGTGYASLIWKGRLYLGTNQGLFSTPYPLNLESKYRKVTDKLSQVWSLSEYDGSLFCCHDGGVYIIYGDGHTQNIRIEGAWKLESPAGKPEMLVGSGYNRLFVLKKSGGRWHLSHFIKGSDNSSKAFCFDEKGRMWLSHWVKGLFRISFDDGYTTVLSHEYFGTNHGFPTDANNIPNMVGGKMIFSTEGGFYSYKENLQKAFPVDSLNSRFTFSPIITTLLQFPDGNDFYSSGSLQALGYRDEQGQYKIDSLSLKYLVGKRPLGFESTLYLEDGKILLNTENGFSIINTNTLKDRKANDNPLIIRSVTSIEGPRERVLLQNYSAAALPELTLSPEQTTLRFAFRMIEQRMSGAVTYSCKLDGYDSDWSRPSLSGTKDYTRLPYGDHVFKVRAYNLNTGQTAESEIRFHIRWPWYLSGWALACYVILLGLLVYAVTLTVRRLYRHRLAEETAKKEKEMEEKKMKEDLLTKVNELATSTMNLLRKNEELIDIQKELDRMEKMVRSEEKPEKVLAQIAKMKDGIDVNIRHDEDWKRFEKNFDIVYDEYLTRLADSFPELTLGDKKLCAYLKMGLSSKEIAPLMNLTFRSVEMTRYRLRKKLRLSRDQNLIDFLQKF